jgi:hypothetical protein
MEVVDMSSEVAWKIDFADVAIGLAFLLGVIILYRWQLRRSSRE